MTYPPTKCPFCGGTIIYDEETGEYVCSKCGTVFAYEMMPSRTHLLHVSPYGPAVVFPEEMYADIIATLDQNARELLSSLPPPKAMLVLEYLKAIKEGKKIQVPWEVYNYVSEMMKYVTPVNREAIKSARLQKIREYIDDLLKRENSCGITADEVMEFAKKYEHLWAGRHSKVIAEVFTYIYVLNKCGVTIKVSRRSSQLAKVLMKVIK